MVDILPRIKELLGWTGLGPAAFADEVAVARPVISHIISARNKASLEVVQKILQRYPEVEPTWLLLGTGSMLKNIVTEMRSAPAQETPSASATPLVQEALPTTDKLNVQNTNPRSSKSAVENQRNTRIPSKVILFYSDGTFESYENP